MDRPDIPYTRDQLYGIEPPPPLTGRHLDEVAFPLGGLGTGMVSLGGWGQLRDWEIRNRPAKGFGIPQAFFMLRCRGEGVDVTKVLQGPVGGTYTGDGHSLGHAAGQGLPHFREVSFEGRFPIATVRLRDPKVPLTVELEAFNPFIPNNADDSGLPVAILIYRLTNPTDHPVRATVYGNLTNIIGDPAQVHRVNVARAGACRGLLLGTEETPGDDPQLGTMALATPVESTVVLPRWVNQPWFAWLDHYWQATANADTFPPEFGEATPNSDTGTIATTVEVPAGETVEVPMLIAWHFPRVGHWQKQERDGCDCTPSWLNWYATQWDDAWDVTERVASNLATLRAETTLFRDTLFSSTLPWPVMDAVSSQISILKTPTCLRLPDGTFYGFEGCSNSSGCCEGSCTHVWNYAQALPYLFPALQRSMREAEWNWSMRDDGYVTFRMPLPPETRAEDGFHPCADGQMGAVLQVYREMLIADDPEWLRKMWPKTKKALEFAWKYWDADRDGVMEGMQHNTYDIEYYGPNTMMGSLYLAALKAAQKMAGRMDDVEAAEAYRKLFEEGSRWTDEHLFNGEYYEQRVEPEAWRAWPAKWQERSIGKYGYDSRFTDWPKWQVGEGCLSDQLLGQWYAEMLGLGRLYDKDHIVRALRSIFAHNWKPDLTDHPNPMRIYAVGDEAGLLLCSWPRGNRPGDPSVYGDEAWSGIEYQVAAHMIYEGLVDEGLAIVKGVRDRYTGERRNPWDEIECGHHYVRSMASYSLLLALAGFRYVAGAAHLEFKPRLDLPVFRAFYSLDSGYGAITLDRREDRAAVIIEPIRGSLEVGSVYLSGLVRDEDEPVRVTVGELAVQLERQGTELFVVFKPVTIRQGEKLRVRVRPAE